MLVKKGKANWMYVAIIFLSAAVTGMFLISYINSEIVQGADDTNGPQSIR